VPDFKQRLLELKSNPGLIPSLSREVVGVREVPKTAESVNVVEIYRQIESLVGNIELNPALVQKIEWV